ncbi:MAG: YgjV family protein [Acetobacteraceae bacterium]|nr:YgjV family protein [Acetobacteraceae bacterium]
MTVWAGTAPGEGAVLMSAPNRPTSVAPMIVFSPAQCVGYIAFVLGVTAFLQRLDWKLKAFNASESVAYAVHFFLLGNPAASASSLIASVRSTLAIKLRSPVLAMLLILVTLGAGACVARSWTDWIPVIASCIATYAVFLMTGIQLRLAFLVCTLLWLVNNILSGSIGGTALETTIGLANGTTIIRLLRAPRLLPDGTRVGTT